MNVFKNRVIKRVILKLAAPEVALDYHHEIPRMPESLEKPTSKREVEYLKYIKKVI